MTKKRSSSTATTTTTAGNFIVVPFPPLRRCSVLPTDIPPPPPPPPQPPRSPEHGLLRAISDPNLFLSHSPSSYVAPPPAYKSPVSSDTADDSPASKRLKRMSQRMRVMKQWFDQLIQDSSSDKDDDNSGGEDEAEENEEINGSEKCAKEMEEKEKETEEMKKERDGDGVNFEFKCPCGNDYHILLLGHDCYYKLL